jgi:hypothetical protein
MLPATCRLCHPMETSEKDRGSASYGCEGAHTLLDCPLRAQGYPQPCSNEYQGQHIPCTTAMPASQLKENGGSLRVVCRNLCISKVWLGFFPVPTAHQFPPFPPVTPVPTGPRLPKSLCGVPDGMVILPDADQLEAPGLEYVQHGKLRLTLYFRSTNNIFGNED